MRLAPIPAPIASRLAVQRMNVLLVSLTAAQTADQSSGPKSANHLPIGGVLLALWGAGAFISLLGLFRGLRLTRRITRSVQPILVERIEFARSELLSVFGQSLPPVYWKTELQAYCIQGDAR